MPTAAYINKQNCIVQSVPINRFGAAAIYPRYPAARNTPDGHGVDLIGISPLRGSLEAVPIA